MRPAGAPPPAPAEGIAARRAALVALAAVEDDGAWSNLVVPTAIASLADPRDRAFAAHLAYDTLRWQATLDWALASVLRRPLAEVEPALGRVVRLGALQLLRTAVPPRAAVATSVALAREQVPGGRAIGAAGFVNGVLRALARRLEPDGQGLPWPDAAADPVAALALSTGHPPWVVEDLRKQHDDVRVRAILEADNAPPGLTLRATGDRDALVAELLADGHAAAPGTHPAAVRVPGADPRVLACVAEGRAVPQDEASMHVVSATGVRAGDRVLDLCAGPGGKTTHLAALAGAAGRVTAIELHPHRAQLVREAAARQGVAVEVRVGDAATLAPSEGGDEVVLLDAPCTGLGTGRRRPEVRWRRTPEDVQTLAEVQLRLLRAAIRHVAPGGTLTYAVCTWTQGETVAVVAAAGDELARAGLVAREARQLLPDQDGTDGMFVASWHAGRGRHPG